MPDVQMTHRITLRNNCCTEIFLSLEFLVPMSKPPPEREGEVRTIPGCKVGKSGEENLEPRLTFFKELVTTEKIQKPHRCVLTPELRLQCHLEIMM